jgi:hypothetical protein
LPALAKPGNFPSFVIDGHFVPGRLKWKNLHNGDVGVPMMRRRMRVASSFESPVAVNTFFNCGVE